MDQEQLLKLFFNETYPSQSIYVSFGIDTLQNDYANIIHDPKQKLLIFYENAIPKKYTTVKAVLQIDKIINVEFGDRNSPLSCRGSQSNCLNMCITYKSNDAEHEILFSHIGFTEKAFKNLYNELSFYINKPQQFINEHGIIEL